MQMRIFLAAYNVLKEAQGAGQCPGRDPGPDPDPEPGLDVDLDANDPAS